MRRLSPKWHRHQRALQRRALKLGRRIKRRRRSLHGNPHNRKTNRAKPFLPKRAGSLICPATLDFGSDPVDTVKFMMDVRAALTQGEYSRILIDHAALRNLSPSAALVLIAEMFYAQQFAPSVELLCKFPKTPAVRDLLGQIGYFKYFPAVSWSAPPGGARFFLEHRRGEGVDRDAARVLLDHLRTTGKLSSSLLYEALAEGMQNAAEWGYENRQTGYRLWWLLGYRDASTGEIAYCFYDQGAGIPATIRTRLSDRVAFLRPKGSQLIRRAVIAGHYSRTGKPSRGRGLPTLKRFIDAAAAGELLIHSRESQCIFRTGHKPRLSDYSVLLRGTLISWTFQP